ncbi:MAG: glycosyltransferase [Kofleriaceae bacterium]|nr:glycosyltransferase [Kofleriaceae bacterium]
MRHCNVVVLAPSSPGALDEERWGEVTVVRHRYFAPKSAQRLTGGEGVLASLRGDPLTRLQAPLLVGSQLAAIPRLLRRYAIDIVNSHWLVPQGLNAALVRTATRTPHVATAHAADVALLQRARLGRHLARFILDRTDMFLPVSSYLARSVDALVGHRVRHRVVPMGVSAERFQPKPPDPASRMILFVGKLVPKKGLRYLLEAVALLVERGVRAHLVIVGGGPLEPDVRADVTRLGLDATVELAGWVKNTELPAVYARAAVVCVPSIIDERGETEGMPVVVQEALASGRVVVASEVSGIPDVIDDGRNGFLVPPRDPAALAAALERALLISPQVRAAVGSAARETALSHTWERVAERYAEVFDEVSR